MINAFLREIDKHVVCESTNLIGTVYGRHIFNIKANEDIDNGKVVNLDDMVWEANEYFTMVEPTATSRVGLILSVPVGADATPYVATRESNFYNGEGEIMRVYDLIRGDKFTISENGITKKTNNGTELDIEVGDYIYADGYDLTDNGSTAPSGKTFVAQVLEKINRGANGVFYKLVVRAND